MLEFLLVFSVLKMSSTTMNRSKRTNYYHYLMITVLVFLISIIALTIVQMAKYQSYSLSMFILTIGYDFGVSSIIIVILVSKFSSWFRSNKNLYELLYIVSFSALLVSIISACIGLIQELGDRYSPITAISNPWDRMSTIKPIFYDVFRISFLISFGFVWLATSFFLKNYLGNHSSKFNKWKYWILAILPLIYYISASDFVINSVLNYLIFEYPGFTNFILYFLGGAKQVGGFFFALPILFMAKNTVNINLKYYLLLTAIGLMILYSSIQISILHILPYPPFGLNTLSVMPIASYLVLTGLYYSAKSVSYDRELLLRLKKQIKNESHSFLNAIGSAEWNRNIESTVHNILEQVEVTEEPDSNLEEDDIRNYISEVINELSKEKEKSPTA